MENSKVSEKVCVAKHSALDNNIAELKTKTDRLFGRIDRLHLELSSKIDRSQWLMVTTCAMITGSVILFAIKGCA